MKDFFGMHRQQRSYIKKSREMHWRGRICAAYVDL
jgi:hypothetical protein